jgi:hypothetical protein
MFLVLYYRKLDELLCLSWLLENKKNTSHARKILTDYVQMKSFLNIIHILFIYIYI